MDQTPDLSQLMQLARSPTGQQLLQLLKQNGTDKLNTAARMAAAGNMDQAKEQLSELLHTPQAQQLLQQLEREL